MLDRTFTVDSPPSHQEVSGVCAPLLDPAVQKDVDDLSKSSCLDGYSISEVRSIPLDESLEILGVLEQESERPFIAVSRAARKKILKDSLQDTPLSPGCPRHEINHLASVGPKRWESELPLDEPLEESQYFDYEPSVLQFEDIIDSRMFYEPSTVSSLSCLGLYDLVWGGPDLYFLV